MPLVKSKGNMYEWVSHCHSHLAGECPHRCGYCYVQTNPRGVNARWKGEPRLIEDELKVKYDGRWFDKRNNTWKTEKIIFIEHMSDLFAWGIHDEWITAILEHCKKYPKNTYVFQSKNPQGIWNYANLLPPNCIIGTTIETNRIVIDSSAPMTSIRFVWMEKLKKEGYKTFVTIEPIKDFDYELTEWMVILHPEFINIGADSKNCHLPEPSPEKIRELIAELRKAKIEVREKPNLNRLMKY